MPVQELLQTDTPPEIVQQRKPSRKFSEVYDRYGNRWQQNMLAGEGAEPQLSFNASNQMVGYSYDAAGNVANDGYHSYTWDAENNLLSTDNGQTESYVRDALGHEVRANAPAYNNSVEFYWSPFGQLLSEWNPANGSQWQGTYLWGSTPVAFYAYDGTTHFEHQDWVNTERLRTTYNGKIEATVDSLPFGDGMTVNGPWYDPPRHAFGYMYDSTSNTYPVGARTYSQTEGRWLSPDPYDGSYDFANPQSFNRYAYALNNPLAFTDPTGMDCDDNNGTYTGATTSGDPTSGFTTTVGVSGGCNGVLVWYCGEYGGCGPDGQNPQPPQPHAPPAPPNNGCKTGFGFGVTAGADTALGVMKGTSGTGSVGAGLFFSPSSASAGTYASGGIASNIGAVRGQPSQSLGTPASLGGGVGPVGGGLFVTNASSASQLSGPFLTIGGAVSVGLGLGAQVSFGYDSAGNLIWQGSLTMGFGAGAYGYVLTTNTKAATTGPNC